MSLAPGAKAFVRELGQRHRVPLAFARPQLHEVLIKHAEEVSVLDKRVERSIIDHPCQPSKQLKRPAHVDTVSTARVIP